MTTAAQVRRCPVCRDRFVASKVGTPQIYCTARCRYRAKNRRRWADIRVPCATHRLAAVEHQRAGTVLACECDWHTDPASPGEARDAFHAHLYPPVDDGWAEIERAWRQWHEQGENRRILNEVWA